MSAKMSWIQVIESKYRGVVKTFATEQKKEKCPTCTARGGWILAHNITQATVQPSFFSVLKHFTERKTPFFFFVYMHRYRVSNCREIQNIFVPNIRIGAL